METVQEDKEFLHTQLVDAKTINKSLMYELDQYKQQFGKLDEFLNKPYQALEDVEASIKYSRKMFEDKKEAPTNIFEPTQLPDNSAKISLDEPSGSLLTAEKASELPNW